MLTGPPGRAVPRASADVGGCCSSAAGPTCNVKWVALAERTLAILQGLCDACPDLLCWRCAGMMC